MGRSLRTHCARTVARTALGCAALLLQLPITAAANDAITSRLPGRLLSIEVYPPSIQIARKSDYRQLLLTAELESGERVDATRLADIKTSDPSLSVSDRGILRAGRDGSFSVSFILEGRSIAVPVEVGGVEAPLKTSFVEDVMPLLSKLGCNAGTCHGSAKGRNGFKLSLRGYDPAFDHIALTDDLAGRRFNRAAPEQSLFLMKPTAAVPHTGGLRLSPGDVDYEILRSWVESGARLDRDCPRVTGIEIHPRSPVIPLPGMSQQMAVLATFADGRVRDVTEEAFVETNNTEVTQVETGGLVTALRRGDVAILARYEGRYASTRLFVMGDRSGFAGRDFPRFNDIDEFIDQKLASIRALPSGSCSDAEFLRRVSIDLTSLPPRVEEVRTFLMDRRDSRRKREELVDRLIGGSAFVDQWTNKWCDLLQVNPKFLGLEGAQALRQWIRAALASNMPYDEFVRAILMGSGSTLENPPAAYYKVLRQPDLAMENTTHLFLGVRFNCNKCHDHPFERWTQKDHWQLAAYFAQVERKNAPGSPLMPLRGDNQPEEAAHAYEELISDSDTAVLKHPDTGAIVEPRFPFEHAGTAPEKVTRRGQLSAWLTSPENPYFARSYVNRVWSYFFGIGLIEPVDDIRASNPPTHPELLDRLTNDFIAHSFDVRWLMRTICTSRAYQTSIQTNEWNVDDDLHYAHATLRRLPAETLFDALHQAAGSRPRLPGVRAGTKAVELVEASVPVKDRFMELFGRPPRESACECERQSGMSLGQALNLVNGPTVAELIHDPENGIAELVAFEKDSRKIVEEIFLSFLSRPPSEPELPMFAARLDPYRIDNLATLSPGKLEELEKKRTDWESSISAPQWSTLAVTSARSDGGAQFVVQADGSVLVEGNRPDKDHYQIVAFADQTGITGLRLEVLPDPTLPKNGPGRADNGNFVVKEVQVLAVPAHDPAGARPVAFAGATADFSQQDYDASLSIDGKLETGWAVVPNLGVAHELVLECKEDVGVAGGTMLFVSLPQDFGGFHTLGRLRLSATTSKRPVRHHGFPENVAAALRAPAAERTPEQKQTVHEHFVSLSPELADSIRLCATQDLAWALANSSAFLFR